VSDDDAVLLNFLEDITTFVDNVLKRPPEAMRGVWLGQQKAAWAEFTDEVPPNRQWRRGADRKDDEEEERTEEEVARDAHQREGFLRQHGLWGQALQTKMRAWRDKVRAFLQLRNTRRLKAALAAGGLLLDSILEATGIDAWLGEAVKGLQQLAETALEEGA
jgi:hypothetical protein